jgi:hypothetical protein
MGLRLPLGIGIFQLRINAYAVIDKTNKRIDFYNDLVLAVMVKT